MVEVAKEISLRTLVLAACTAAVALMPAAAAAFPVTVDGDASDWPTTNAVNVNSGEIVRTSLLTGAYVWNDEAGDERTDLSAGGPDPEADLQRVMITGDTTYLYILIETSTAAPTVAQAPQYQVLVDQDRTAGSGNAFFMGFGDTDVAADAGWEYAIATAFGSGSTTPLVWDVNSTNVATMASSNARVGPVTEIAVAWTDLGYAPGTTPDQPLRFAIASFHANAMDNTVDVGGAAVSNAIDVLTHYGTPGSTGNSWNELSDGVVDYYFDVWFHLDPDGEPSSPVLIAEVAYDTNVNGEEFVELVNVSDADLDLDGYRLTDEETIGGGEGAHLFPSWTLSAAQRVVIADEQAAHFAAYGVFPNFELNDTHPLVDQLVSDSMWGSGSITLANSGDQVLITDDRDTILDVVSWEGGGYGDVVPHPGVSKGESLERSPERRDRDDCSADFLSLATPTPGAGSSPCVAGDLTTRPAGAACDDNDPCSSGETCDSLGNCGSGTPVMCAPTANPCVSDACDPVFLGCGGPEPTTTPCDDGDACTGPDTCDGVNACDNSVTVVCPAPGNACESSSCDSVLGCNAPVGTSCDDGDPCTANDACDGAGNCQGPDPTDCSVPDEPCLVGMCDAVMGCVTEMVADDTACEDGNLCTSNTVCSSGVCGGGDETDCSAAGNQCNAGVCEPATGDCVQEPLPNGTVCDDQDPCTEGEICQNGECYGGGWICGDDVADDLDMSTMDSGDTGDTADMSMPEDVLDPMPSDANVDGIAEPTMPEPKADEGCGCRVRGKGSDGTGLPLMLLSLVIVGLMWHTNRRT